MGIMGSGKTTIGELLSEKLRWGFRDADDFHPQQNKEKMKSGVPLDDNDRIPWLLKIREFALEKINNNQNFILSCSALKKKYRDLLRFENSNGKLFIS